RRGHASTKSRRSVSTFVLLRQSEVTLSVKKSGDPGEFQTTWIVVTGRVVRDEVRAVSRRQPAPSPIHVLTLDDIHRGVGLYALHRTQPWPYEGDGQIGSNAPAGAPLVHRMVRLGI